MIPPPTISPHGKAIARLLADWASPAPGVTIYFFGSRVRGDHGPASDVDVCIQFGQVGQNGYRLARAQRGRGLRDHQPASAQQVENS